MYTVPDIKLVHHSLRFIMKINTYACSSINLLTVLMYVVGAMCMHGNRGGYLCRGAFQQNMRAVSGLEMTTVMIIIISTMIIRIIIIVTVVIIKAITYTYLLYDNLNYCPTTTKATSTTSI